MSHFAKIENSIVTQVIVADQEFVNSLEGDWVETTYGARGGISYGQDLTPDGRPVLRKNYAGIGYTYDSQRDAFIEPKPFQSWILNEETCIWEPPTPRPDDGKIYAWDEQSTSWVEEPEPPMIVMNGKNYSWNFETKSWVEVQ